MITHKKTSAFFAENHAFSFHSGPFNLLLLSQFLRYRSQYCLLCTLRAPANCLFLQMSFRCKKHLVSWESHVFFRFSVIATNVNFTDAYGITKTIFRKKQNIGLLWAKVRMFCIESTDVCLKEVRCFCFPERRITLLLGYELMPRQEFLYSLMEPQFGHLPSVCKGAPQAPHT